ncbi:MAG: hypothetical protein ACI9U5_001695, partial [Colwellia sp.]
MFTGLLDEGLHTIMSKHLTFIFSKTAANIYSLFLRLNVY